MRATSSAATSAMTGALLGCCCAADRQAHGMGHSRVRRTGRASGMGSGCGDRQAHDGGQSRCRRQAHTISAYPPSALFAGCLQTRVLHRRGLCTSAHRGRGGRSVCATLLCSKSRQGVCMDVAGPGGTQTPAPAPCPPRAPLLAPPNLLSNLHLHPPLSPASNPTPR